MAGAAGAKRHGAADKEDDVTNEERRNRVRRRQRAREREDARQLSTTEVERMVSDAAIAAELFGEDGLEGFAAALRRERRRA